MIGNNHVLSRRNKLNVTSSYNGYPRRLRAPTSIATFPTSCAPVVTVKQSVVVLTRGRWQTYTYSNSQERQHCMYSYLVDGSQKYRARQVGPMISMPLNLDEPREHLFLPLIMQRFKLPPQDAGHDLDVAPQFLSDLCKPQLAAKSVNTTAMVRAMLFSLTAAAALLVSRAGCVSYNGLAITPQMGWVCCLSSHLASIGLTAHCRITGTPLVAMSARISFSVLRRRLSTTASGI